MVKSKSYVKKAGKIKLDGKGGFGGFGFGTYNSSPENRHDVLELASRAGFSSVTGTENIGDESMGAYLTRLSRLDREYGAIDFNKTKIQGVSSRSRTKAAVSEHGDTLYLNDKALGSAAKAARVTKNSVKTKWNMPTSGKITDNANYTVVHEYGHILEGALYKKAVKEGYKGTSGQFEMAVYRKISSQAQKKYGATNKSLSRYGHTNPAEFFAESFANLHSGAPNGFGLALQDYLKNNSLK